MLGLETKNILSMQQKYGKNEFRPMKLTTIGQTVSNMMSDISLQFLLIAALVATVLEMS